MHKIEILNWDKYNPRKDYKQPRWFAFSNRMLEDPIIDNLNDSEFKAWVFILCQASQQNSRTVHVLEPYAKRYCNISAQNLRSTIGKLEKAGIIRVHVIERTDDVRETNVTLHNITLHNNTEHIRGVAALPALALIWNEHCGERGKVEHCGAARKKRADARFKEISRDEWVEIVQRIAKSDFCNGRTSSGNWVATFDWFVGQDRYKVPNYEKVKSGNYDNRVAAKANDEDKVRIWHGK